MKEPAAFCGAMDEWAEIVSAKDHAFADAWRVVRLAIGKSCLLDRVLYHGEQPSKTPCPVHKGKWSGMHLGWPGTFWSDGRPIVESKCLRGWYDAGCRCYQHGCGCTTGWQLERVEPAQ